jgi:serine/threonine-protein phosphatase 2B catalytic subunit
MTSPSTRRRSIDTTMNLIKEAVDGKPGDPEQYDELAEHLSSPLRGKGNSAA